MPIGNLILYIKGNQNVEVQSKEVTLGDVLEIECTNSQMMAKIKATKLLKINAAKKHRYVISILKIFEIIHQQYPNVQIENVGPTDIIVTYEPHKKKNQFAQWVKIIFVVAITFSGAAFSIMAFNNDINTPKLFEQIYQQIMGEPKKGFTILELTYSIGVAVGILVFFNHFGKKRFSVDPTPMEVEMCLYENDIQTTLIETYARKEQELNVGKGNNVGNHRP